MSVATTIDVLLRGDTGSLDNALDKTQKKVKDFTDKTAGNKGGFFNSLGTGINELMKASPGALGASWSIAAAAMTGGLAGVATAAIGAGQQLANFISESMHGIADLARTAATLGVTTSALAGLQHGAALAGVGTEDLDHGLLKFQKHISEASHGTGEAITAFARLGLEARQLKELPLEQAVARVGEALRKTGNSADQLQLTLQLFGKSAGPLKEFLKSGTEGMAAMQAEAKRLGLAVSGEQAAQVQQATKAWRQFDEAIKGTGRSLAIIFAPAMAKAQNQLNGVAGGGAENLSSSIRFWQELVSVAFDVAKAMREIGFAMTGIPGIFQSISGSVNDNKMTWRDLQLSILTFAYSVQFALENWKESLGIIFLNVTKDLVKLGNHFANLWQAIKAGDMSKAFNPQPTDFEKGLDILIAQRQRNFKNNLNQFMLDKLNQFNKPLKPDAVDKGEGLNAIVSKKPAAMEAGSKEAFSVLYGTEDAQKKALNVANDQLKENKKANDLLKMIVKKRFGLKKANF